MTAQPAPAEGPLRASRNDAIDLLRAVVMVLMALDHARDFLGQGLDPTDLAHTTPVLFFTRWITHFCASVFVFLAGTAAGLSTAVPRAGTTKGGKTIPQLSRFLLTRGLWLVFLEFSIVRFCWLFDPGWHFAVMQVIWAIGCSMIVLAALVWLPRWAIATVGIGMIAGHNALDGLHADAFGAMKPAWIILHEGGRLGTLFGAPVMTFYPLVPWIGVMACGYCFSSLLRGDAATRRARTLRLGLALIAGFVVLRATNLYGDPEPWVQLRSFGYTILSFLNCEKYPPSLLYLMMTLGPALCVLALLDRDRPVARGSFASMLVVYGRVPLFYYVLHIFFIHLLAVLVDVPREGAVKAMMRMYLRNPVGWSLGVVYVAWIAIVLALFPLCRWFAALKQRRRDPWLSYL
jgi:uncharacterized membrane protein